MPEPPRFDDPLSTTGGFGLLEDLRPPEPAEPVRPAADAGTGSWSLVGRSEPGDADPLGADRRRVTAIPRMSERPREGAPTPDPDLETTLGGVSRYDLALPGRPRHESLPTGEFRTVDPAAGRPNGAAGERPAGGPPPTLPAARNVELPRQREGRVMPPWQADDLPAEPPSLRLVEPAPLADPALSAPAASYSDELSSDFRAEARNLRLVEPTAPPGAAAPPRARRSDDRLTGPMPAAVNDDGDNDLLIFAAARSAWFTDYDTEGANSGELNWGSNDVGWRAAEQASRPTITGETQSGLPRRVPQQNLVPGSPTGPAAEEERPLRVVRDPATIAAHTTGYFRGWRRGQEVGGYSVGGRPGRESAGGWDFSREQSRDYTEEEYEFRSARR